jgi:NADH-quinone oxidoreductase subunit H
MMDQILKILDQIINLVGMLNIRVALGLGGVMGLITVSAMVLTWAERKVAGHMQRRIAAKEVGPFGLIQPIADVLKLMGKELLTPKDVQKSLYFLGPILIFVPVLISFIVIPFDSRLQIMDINVGVLVILAFSSLGVLSILISGWGSNNKYSLIGAVRSVAQNIAYEIPLLLSLLAVVFMSNSLSMKDIVESQKGLFWHWYVFQQPVAFIIFFIACVAETNRTPFDLPEGESELVAGFHTEYSGMRFALFFLAEYTNMVIVSAVATTLFLGGYEGPVLPGVVWFFLKTYFLVFLMLWFRWTFPRVRFDQLLNFSWKILMPLSFLNLIATGALLKLL